MYRNEDPNFRKSGLSSEIGLLMQWSYIMGFTIHTNTGKCATCVFVVYYTCNSYTYYTCT